MSFIEPGLFPFPPQGGTKTRRSPGARRGADVLRASRGSFWGERMVAMDAMDLVDGPG